MNDVKKSPQIVMSNTDAELSDIIASQSAEFDIRDPKTYNPFDIPEECKVRSDKDYRYRWVSKDKRMIERAMYKGWKICNKMNSPYIPSRLFGLHGAVEKLGHLLAFIPLKKAEDMRKESGDKSREAVKLYTEDIKKDPRFYDAKIGEKDGTDEQSLGLQQGRDF
jgi:hypothetical protein